MWECPLCTYRSNDDLAEECEICDGPRPAAEKAQVDSQTTLDGAAAPGNLVPAAAAATAAAPTVSRKPAPKRGLDRQQPPKAPAGKQPEIEEQPLSEEDEAWCAAANSAFLALIQLAVLFHVRRAPLFLRSIADTVSQQNSGQPFDEVTARAFARISPRQVSLRHEANAQEGQIGTAELRVVVHFEHSDPDGPAADPMAKRPRASPMEPSRSGGLPAQSRWRGSGSSWSTKTSSIGMEQLVVAAKVEFARRCQMYARLRRKEGRGLPRLHENDQTQAPSVFAGRRQEDNNASAAAEAASSTTSSSSSWSRGEKVTAVNILEYLKATDDYSGQLVHVEPVPARPAELRDYPTRLAPEVKAGLQAAGITQLFSHQVEGIEAVLDGAPGVPH